MNKITKFISEQMFLIFFIIVIGAGLISSVIILANIINQSPAINNLNQSSEITSFDQSTITRLEQLDISDNVNDAPSLPTSRTNPFSE